MRFRPQMNLCNTLGALIRPSAPPVLGEDSEITPQTIEKARIRTRQWRPAERRRESLKHEPRPASPPHAGVGERLEARPARGVQRREPVGLARALDRVGDASAGVVALGGGAPFRYASALALRQEGAVVRLGREPAPGGKRREEPDQDRLMHEIDRQAVPAGEACRAPGRRRRAPALRRHQPRQDAGRSRDAEAQEDHAGPRQERAPVERVGERLAEPEP